MLFRFDMHSFNLHFVFSNWVSVDVILSSKSNNLFLWTFSLLSADCNFASYSSFISLKTISVDHYLNQIIFIRTKILSTLLNLLKSVIETLLQFCTHVTSFFLQSCYSNFYLLVSLSLTIITNCIFCFREICALLFLIIICPRVPFFPQWSLETFLYNFMVLLQHFSFFLRREV